VQVGEERIKKGFHVIREKKKREERELTSKKMLGSCPQHQKLAFARGEKLMPL